MAAEGQRDRGTHADTHRPFVTIAADFSGVFKGGAGLVKDLNGGNVQHNSCGCHNTQTHRHTHPIQSTRQPESGCEGPVGPPGAALYTHPQTPTVRRPGTWCWQDCREEKGATGGTKGVTRSGEGLQRSLRAGNGRRRRCDAAGAVPGEFRDKDDGSTNGCGQPCACHCQKPHSFVGKRHCFDDGWRWQNKRTGQAAGSLV